METPTNLLPSSSEPWYCDGCHAMIYNRDADGNPAAGAPSTKYLNEIYKNVCTLCFQLGSVIRDSSYWKNLAEAHASKMKKLGSDGSYFG
jgi:hypothetical protein